jgi:1-aminocyclopropane-1-carboxylate deaminase
MAIDFKETIKIDVVENDLLKEHQIELGVLRLDQIHPIVSGNKWFKLKYNIEDAFAKDYKTILTFGGAYSNHLIATAAAAKAFGLSSVGLVRGLHAQVNYTDTLHACENMGMQLHFIARENYAKKEDDFFLGELQMQYPDAYIIPEGGNNERGRKGTAEISSYIPASYTHVALAIGTGATFAGIRTALDPAIEMLGFTVMKGGVYLEEEIKNSLPVALSNWSIIPDYHFGGFAKSDDVLIDFMNNFYRQHAIPLDKVYTAKLLFGVMDMIKNDSIPKGSKMLCIHTGGLQGNYSIKNKLLF